MKVFVVLALALACVSAASIPETAVFLKDLKADNVIEGRITNGHEASPGQFPYQAGLSLNGDYGSFWCGGSLIGKEWVLTAAHCTDGVRSITVYLGSTSRAVAKVTYSVDYNSIFQHRDYDPFTFNNDITLIKIPAVTFTDEIQPIRLPAISETYPTYDGTWPTASGWGKIEDAGWVVWGLKYVQLEVISNAECAQTYGPMITDAILCVSTPDGTSTCQGDSGGPLALGSELIGVTSFVSSGGCESGYPSGFARVTTYLEWIKSLTGISY
ncbi:Serine protease 3 [Lucilia cuprina]|nr:Serine protease 3 [Lucilia cuprina]